MIEFPRKIRRAFVAGPPEFQEHEGTLSAAGIAYYVALSFFPLLLVLVAGLAAVLQWTQIGQDAEHEMLHTIAQQTSPDLAKQVGRMLRTVRIGHRRAGRSGSWCCWLRRSRFWPARCGVRSRVADADQSACDVARLGARLVFQRLKSLAC